MPEVELPNGEELEEAARKHFTKRVALTTAIFAVILAITSLGGNNAMKEMLLAQQQASDQWSFYQSKVIREHFYKMERMRIEADFGQWGASLKPGVRDRYETIVRTISEEEHRFSIEKQQIERNAKALEHERDINRSKDPYFDYAEVLLQISIVMASISILAVSRYMFYFALIASGLGSLFMLNGYLLIVRIPFFH